MKIITLIEDHQVDHTYGSEHGVSFYIETDKHKVLFDLGQSCLFSCNAKRLSVRIEDVDIVVISHGHYDHGGGLEDFLRLNKKAKIYIQKSAFDAYYSMRKKDEYTYIGLQQNLNKERFILLEGDYQIDEELYVFNHIEKNQYFPNSNHTMFKKIGETMVLDDFKHEQNLIISSNHKRVLFAGCAHKGIVNIVDQAQKLIHDDHIDAVFGGFHLKSRYQEYEETIENIEKIGKFLLNKPVLKYYTGHCIGDKAFQKLK